MPSSIHGMFPSTMSWSDAHVQTFTGIGCWTVCSVGMMVFNKMAIQAFPLECTLVAVQMGFCVLTMLVCCWNSIHIGSLRDAMRWSMVAPLFVGMLLTSILALKDAPMTLVVTFRVLSPLLSLAIERFYPSPLRISPGVVCSIAFMVFGTGLYASMMPKGQFTSIQWVILNILFGTGDRLLQRLMLAKDQSPVDLSKSAATLLNNLLGIAPLLLAAWFKGELAEAPEACRALGTMDISVLLASCIVGVGISYCGIWAQSLISATSFLVLVNANKFVIIFFEYFIMHSKALGRVQVLGAAITICAGVAYGKAREALERREAEEAKAGKDPVAAIRGETKPLVAKNV